MIEIPAMKSILIIGASRGIGLELVRQYTEDGRRVIATVRDDAGRERVQALGADVLTVDVANPASVSSLAWQLDGEKLDLAIYVAGIIRRPNALTPPTQQDFDAVMHTNVLGAMQAIPQVAPLVADAGGRVRLPVVVHVANRQCAEQRCVAVPHQQGRAEHGGGCRPAQLPRRHAAHHRPRLGADRHGRRHCAADGGRQRARSAQHAGQRHPG